MEIYVVTINFSNADTPMNIIMDDSSLYDADLNIYKSIHNILRQIHIFVIQYFFYLSYTEQHTIYII